MGAEYTITRAKNAGEKDNPRGGKLVKWYVDLDGPDGEVKDVYTQKKPGNDLSVGDKIYGRIEEGDYGPRFFGEQNSSGGGFSGGGGGGSKRDSLTPEQWAARDRRISRAGLLQAVVGSAQVSLPVAGEPLTAYLAEVNRITDALAASLDERAPSPNASAPTTSAVSPAQRSVEHAGVGGTKDRDNAASELATTNQKRALTIGFQRLGLTRDAQAKVVAGFVGEGVKLPKTSASQLLDLVNDESKSEDQKLHDLTVLSGVELAGGFPPPADDSDLVPAGDAF